MYIVICKYRVAFILLFFWGAAGAQANVHVHGQGQLLIAQDGQQWQLQFLLPAADIIGFEHEAQTLEEKQALARFLQRVEGVNTLFVLPSSCSINDFSHSLMRQSKASEDDHSAHTSNEKKHTHGHKHDNHQQDNHKDIELSYTFTCQKTPQAFEVSLFTWATSLTTLQAQWITNKGQGATILNTEGSILQFP